MGEAEREVDELTVERHRPERWWDAPVVASICCSCCCCCCCCAHSVGAAVGAVAGSTRSLAKGQTGEAREAAFVATLAYWAGVGLVSLLVLLGAFMVDHTMLALLALALLAPLFQLAGSFLALPAILFQPTAERRRAAAAAIGRATLGWFVGGILGGFVMGALVAVLVMGYGILS